MNKGFEQLCEASKLFVRIWNEAEDKKKYIYKPKEHSNNYANQRSGPECPLSQILYTVQRFSQTSFFFVFIRSHKYASYRVVYVQLATRELL